MAEGVRAGEHVQDPTGIKSGTGGEEGPPLRKLTEQPDTSVHTTNEKNRVLSSDIFLQQLKAKLAERQRLADEKAAPAASATEPVPVPVSTQDGVIRSVAPDEPQERAAPSSSKADVSVPASANEEAGKSQPAVSDPSDTEAREA